MKQSHTFRRTLSALVLLLASTLAWAYDFETGGIYYSYVDRTSYTAFEVDGIHYAYIDTANVSVVARLFNEYSGDIVIPSMVTYDDESYNVTEIWDYAFNSCTSLTSIDIPASVTSIEGGAFAGCSSLTSIVIPGSVTSIGDGTFSGCSSLTSIVIPDGVTSIGDGAFENCSSLTSVICRAESVPSTDPYAFEDTPLSKATLYVPASARDAYKQAYWWREFGKILPIEGGTGIDSPAAWSEDDNANGGEGSAAPYFTLDGKRVSAPVHGGIYIRGGKKVLY